MKTPRIELVYFEGCPNASQARDNLREAVEASPPLSANVRETQSTQRIRVGRRQRKRTCWDCEREWKRMMVSR